MGEWRNYHIFYTDLNRLIVECVYPVLERSEQYLKNCFWERHYAGGPHLRVRLHGSADDVSKAASEFVAEANSSLLSFRVRRKATILQNLRRNGRNGRGAVESVRSRVSRQ